MDLLGAFSNELNINVKYLKQHYNIKAILLIHVLARAFSPSNRFIKRTFEYSLFPGQLFFTLILFPTSRVFSVGIAGVEFVVYSIVTVSCLCR